MATIGYQVRRQNHSQGQREELRSLSSKVDSHNQSSQDEFEQQLYEHLRSRSYFDDGQEGRPTAIANLEKFLDVTAVFLNKIKYWLQTL